MSAAVPRAKKQERATSELPAENDLADRLEALPVNETGVTRAHRAWIGEHGTTPLMRAACEGSTASVQALLERGVDVNAKRADGFNALALASFFGHSQTVSLLLCNGADLAATGRSETLPEMWADTRGFLDIGDLLRNARATTVVEPPKPRPASIDEPARFPRPAEKEKVQRTADPVLVVKASKIDDADSAVTLTASTSLVAEEYAIVESESSLEIFQADQLQQTQEQLETSQPVRAPKFLPEIIDPPPLIVPEFHPGSVFISRLTSSRQSLVALIVAVLLVGAGIAYMFPQIRKSLPSLGRDATTATTTPATSSAEPDKVVASRANVPGNGEVKTSPATKTEAEIVQPAQSTTAPAVNDIQETGHAAKNTESASKVEPAEVAQTTPAVINSAWGSEARGHSMSTTSEGNPLGGLSARRRLFRSTSMTSWENAPKQPGQQAVKLKQTSEGEQPKPAPLSVETSRSRSVAPAPVSSANETSGAQPPPAGKPKPKVIQWP